MYDFSRLDYLESLGFNMPFSAEALEQARIANNTRVRSFMTGRTDLRGRTVLAFKDRGGCDCAFSIRRTKSGFDLDVHVIDADEFVCEGSPLDLEAKKRFTAFTLAGTEHSILPQRLIDGVCGFAEGEDRLAVSVMMSVDENCKLQSIDLQKTLLCASAVCDYAEIDAFYTGKDRTEYMWIHEKYAPFADEIEAMYDLGARMHAARRRAGAAEYSRFESVTERDKDGKVVNMYCKERESDADRLITEFLLYAGCMTARFFEANDAPTLYTVSAPMYTADAEFLCRASGFDYRPSRRNADAAQRELAEHIALHDKSGVLAATFHALMPRECYSAEYGRNCALGIDGYMRICHPTSNYPDLIGQRIIKSWIRSGAATANLDINRHNRKINTLLHSFNMRLSMISGAESEIFYSDFDEYVDGGAVTAYYAGGGNILFPCGVRAMLDKDVDLPPMSEIQVTRVFRDVFHVKQ